MSQSRRTFIKSTALSGLAATSTSGLPFLPNANTMNQSYIPISEPSPSIIGHYGPWAASLPADPPALSFRQAKFNNIDAWRKEAKEKVQEHLGAPDIGTNPPVTVHKKYTYDGLDVEELSWQLPYGRPTEAILLKPAGATGPLPAVLGLHDHSGDKYFGKRKITQTGERHPMMVELQEKVYSGRAWANDLAKRGYVVLVPDAFAFGSRRIKFEDVEGITWQEITT